MSDNMKRWSAIIGIVLTGIIGSFVTTGGIGNLFQNVVSVEDKPKLEGDVFTQIQRFLDQKEEATEAVKQCEDHLDEATTQLEDARDKEADAVEEARDLLDEVIKDLQTKAKSLSDVVDRDSRPTDDPVKPRVDPSDTSLSGQVANWLYQMDASKSDARALARAFNSVLLGMQTGVLKDAVNIHAAQKSAWALTIRTNTPKWANLKQQFRVTLNALRDEGQLINVQDHITVWTEIIAGINQYVGD